MRKSNTHDPVPVQLNKDISEEHLQTDIVNSIQSINQNVIDESISKAPYQHYKVQKNEVDKVL